MADNVDFLRVAGALVRGETPRTPATMRKLLDLALGAAGKEVDFGRGNNISNEMTPVFAGTLSMKFALQNNTLEGDLGHLVEAAFLAGFLAIQLEGLSDRHEEYAFLFREILQIHLTQPLRLM